MHSCVEIPLNKVCSLHQIQDSRLKNSSGMTSAMSIIYARGVRNGPKNGLRHVDYETIVAKYVAGLFKHLRTELKYRTIVFC